MRFDAVVLDFGNTLAPWTDEHADAVYAAIEEVVVRARGPVPGFRERARDIWRRRNEETLREATVAELCDLFFDGSPPHGLAEDVTKAIHATCLEVCRVPDQTRDVLRRLRGTRPLAVLSNFILTPTVEAVLEQSGVMDCFVHVEVSATRGWRKPHPEPFEVVREKLGAPMERTLMVGDEFWADVVGGHRAGLLTALTHEHRRGPTSDARAPEIRADRIVQALDELL